MIRVYNNLCDACGTCVGVCPVDALAIEFRRLVVYSENCIDCRACERVCPVGISMRQFTNKLNKDALELFAWEAGVEPEKRPPLDVYKVDDYNDFIK